MDYQTQVAVVCFGVAGAFLLACAAVWVFAWACDKLSLI